MDSLDPVAQAMALLQADRLDEAAAAIAPLAAIRRGKQALIDGLIAQRRGDLARALALTGRAVQLDIDDPDALVALAAIQLALGHPSFALVPAARAAKLAPDRPEPYAVLAAAQQRLGGAEAALQSIRRATVAAGTAAGASCTMPSYQAIQAELAKLTAKLGNGDEAPAAAEIRS